MIRTLFRTATPLWRQHNRLISTTFQSSSFIEIKSCGDLRNSTFPEYVGSPHSKLHNIVWRNPLQNIYIVKKPWNQKVREATVEFINFIHKNYPAVNMIVNEDVADELLNEPLLFKHNNNIKPVLFTGSLQEIVNKTDLIVTLGGDGTILRAVSAFSNSNVPPVLSFALGTLGFLLPFDYSTFKQTFEQVYQLRSKALHRNRLECHVVRKREVTEPGEKDLKTAMDKQIELYEKQHYKQNHMSTMIHAMNDISLHRGSQPNLISLDIFIDNEFCTTTTADGIVFSTPTGSTAYSLSSGGSITHPLVPCILLTPVCPRSLSFRPLILPSTSHIMIRLSSDNRNVAIKLNIDGIPQHDLKPGDQIHVVSENGTIFIPGEFEAPPFLQSRNDYNQFIEPGSNGTGKLPDSKSNLKQKGIWCIARSENDWVKDINELLGFNSLFRGSKKLHNN